MRRPGGEPEQVRASQAYGELRPCLPPSSQTAADVDATSRRSLSDIDGHAQKPLARPRSGECVTGLCNSPALTRDDGCRMLYDQWLMAPLAGGPGIPLTPDNRETGIGARADQRCGDPAGNDGNLSQPDHRVHRIGGSGRPATLETLRPLIAVGNNEVGHRVRRHHLVSAPTKPEAGVVAKGRHGEKCLAHVCKQFGEKRVMAR